jgi:hypothetical protein
MIGLSSSATAGAPDDWDDFPFGRELLKAPLRPIENHAQVTHGVRRTIKLILAFRMAVAVY